MIRDLWLVGIGTGSPNHLTLEGLAALRDAAVILMPIKSDEKDDLVHIRREIIAAAGTDARVIPFDYPVRDPSLPYQERVSAWHDEIAWRWVGALENETVNGAVALLVWGDPALYDSTIRIAHRLEPAPNIRVIPGITAVQALTAAHGIPLNTIDGAIEIVTGRNLRQNASVPKTATLVVMLDGECSFQKLTDQQQIHIWWGAYLGSQKEILVQGPLDEVAEKILHIRTEAREKHGWIMDTYMLRRIEP